MDLSQALLCLVSFTTPNPVAGPSKAMPCAVVEQQSAIERQKLNFDFHHAAIERDGSETVMGATTGYESIIEDER
jgi:hypothetical protein